MKFSYIALSPDYQKLTGTISAQSEEEARSKLHAMQLSVVSISELSDVQEAEGSNQLNNDEVIETFYFQVVDRQGKEVDGTIDSDSRFNAFKRLISEYNFEVKLLCNTSVPEALRAQEGVKDLDKYRQQLDPKRKQETSSDQKTSIKVSEKNTKEPEKPKLTEFEVKKNATLKEADKVIRRAEILIDQRKNLLEGAEVQSLTDQINELKKMRLSNNLNYIENLAEKLFVELERISKKHDVPMLKLQVIEEEADTPKEESSSSDNKKTKEPSLDLLQLKNKKLSKIIIPLVRGYWSAKFAKSSLKKAEGQEKYDHYLAELKKWREIQKQKREIERTKLLDQGLLTEQNQVDQIYLEIRSFIGWLLGLYITYFFAAYYLRFKGANWAPQVIVDFVEKTLSTPLLMIIAVLLFFIFLAISLKIYFAKNNSTKAVIAYSAVLIVLLLFLLNYNF
jgi:hypothetical protein